MSRFIKVDEYYVEYIYDDSSKQNILIYQSKNGGGCAVSDINFDVQQGCTTNKYEAWMLY